MQNQRKNRKSFTQRKSQGELRDAPNWAGLKVNAHLIRLQNILVSQVTRMLKDEMIKTLLSLKVISKPEDYKLEDHLNKIKRRISRSIDNLDVWISNSIIQQKWFKIGEALMEKRKKDLNDRTQRIRKLCQQIGNVLRDQKAEITNFQIERVLQDNYIFKIKHDPDLEVDQETWQKFFKQYQLRCHEIDTKCDQRMEMIQKRWNYLA